MLFGCLIILLNGLKLQQGRCRLSTRKNFPWIKRAIQDNSLARDTGVPSLELKQHLELVSVRRDLGVHAPPAGRDLDLTFSRAFPALFCTVTSYFRCSKILCSQYMAPGDRRLWMIRIS